MASLQFFFFFNSPLFPWDLDIFFPLRLVEISPCLSWLSPGRGGDNALLRPCSNHPSQADLVIFRSTSPFPTDFSSSLRRVPPLCLPISFYLPLKRYKATSDPVSDTVAVTHHCQRPSDDNAFLCTGASGLRSS